MIQARLRMVIFGMWMLFWIVSTTLVFLSPWLRPDKAIDPGELGSVLLTLTGIWLPPLSCLASFWFPQSEMKRAQEVQVEKERVWAALLLTGVYLAFVMFLIAWPTYIIDYNTGSVELPEGSSFLERMAESVKIALVVSPIALAPINWLTGGTAPPASAPP